MSEDTARHTNRLIQEDSPYLLQHAHNPVDWYPWGEAAFSRARQEDKPVFLSIGYSTCHWCHVMEHESFADETVAELLNRHFVSIKVDREQRPDLDEIYMTGVQLVTGSGGWPMSSFLTPEGKPFYAGTYFPRDRFIQLLDAIHRAWTDKRDELMESAEKIQAAISAQLLVHGRAMEVGQQQIDQALEQLLANEDKQFGGFGSAPKFPNESNLLLLLDQLERSALPVADNPCWQSLHRALDHMMRGGLFDQLAGGFHRYSTDRHWLVPHFEKMLYNQAQLSRLYARAWRLSGGVDGGENEFRRACEETLDYVLREMCSHHGAFYSATDADSEGVEGKYFVWPYRELEQCLQPRELQLLQQVYGVTAKGNFEGNNILFLPRPMAQTARELGLTIEQLQQQLTPVKQQLLERRRHRVPPLRDDKVITEWNGMMVTALAECGRLLEESRYMQAAANAAQFIWEHSRDRDGRLFRLYRNGHTGTPANLEDYSHYLQGLLALYDATGQQHWLDRSREMHRQMTELFWEDSGGGFYTSQEQTDGPLIVRGQSCQDGACPAGNSVALTALVALNRRSHSQSLDSQIERQIQRFSGAMAHMPSAMCHMLTGVAEYRQPSPLPLQYGAGGNVRIRVRRAGRSDSLSVNVEMAEGWHINSHDAEDNPFSIEIRQSRDVEDPQFIAWIQYPDAVPIETDFADSRLLLYEGTVTTTVEMQPLPERRPLHIDIHFQACCQTHCMAPETVTVLLY